MGQAIRALSDRERRNAGLDWPAVVLFFLSVAAMAVLIALAAGCAGKRVVMVHPEGVLRTGPDVTGHVWYPAKDGTWELSRNAMKLPEGLYITDLPDDPQALPNAPDPPPGGL